MSRQGQGVFVKADVIDYATGSRTRWSENVRSQGYEPTGRFLRSSTVPAAGSVREALMLEDGAPVLRIEALREADSRPITLTYHHFSQADFPDLDVRYRETHSIRSEERRVGKECVSTCRSRWSPDPSKKKKR